MSRTVPAQAAHELGAAADDAGVPVEGFGAEAQAHRVRGQAGDGDGGRGRQPQQPAGIGEVEHGDRDRGVRRIGERPDRPDRDGDAPGNGQTQAGEAVQYGRADAQRRGVEAGGGALAEPHVPGSGRQPCGSHAVRPGPAGLILDHPHRHGALPATRSPSSSSSSLRVIPSDISSSWCRCIQTVW